MESDLKPNELVVELADQYSPCSNLETPTVNRLSEAGLDVIFWGNIKTYKGKCAIWVVREKSGLIDDVAICYPTRGNLTVYDTRRLRSGPEFMGNPDKMRSYLGDKYIITCVSAPVMPFLVRHLFYADRFSEAAEDVFARYVPIIDDFFSTEKVVVRYGNSEEWWLNANMFEIRDENGGILCSHN